MTGEGILFLAFTAGCVGIYYGKAWLSIYTGIIFGVAALNALLHPKWLKEITRYPEFIAIGLLFFVYVLSVFHSDNIARWARLSFDNVLYAAIPLGYYCYRHVTGIVWYRLLLIFLAVSTLSALSVMIDYALHFEEYNALYKIGKTIPTPVIHVRYSYFIALAACLSFALSYEQTKVSRTANSNSPSQSFGEQGWRIALLAGIFLTIVVHVLAVRTGLIALYGGLGLMMLFVVLRDGKWKLGILTALGIFIVFMIAYNAFPSIANKIGYVLYDLNKLKESGALAEYSDNVRITSIQHGLALWKENLITGTGIGDLRHEMHRMYAERSPNFPEESWFPPISQYVYVLTAFGLIGALLFFALLLYPLFKSPFSYVLLAIYATTLFSSIGETTIELQIGKTAFVSLLCIALLYNRQSPR